MIWDTAIPFLQFLSFEMFIACNLWSWTNKRKTNQDADLLKIEGVKIQDINHPILPSIHRAYILPYTTYGI